MIGLVKWSKLLLQTILLSLAKQLWFIRWNELIGVTYIFVLWVCFFRRRLLKNSASLFNFSGFGFGQSVKIIRIDQIGRWHMWKKPNLYITCLAIDIISSLKIFYLIVNCCIWLISWLSICFSSLIGHHCGNYHFVLFLL